MLSDFKNKKNTVNVVLILTTLFMFIAVAMFIGFRLNVNVANAQTSGVNQTYHLLAPLPCIPSDNVKCTSGTPITNIPLSAYFEYAFNFFIAFAAFAAVFMLVFAGFRYVTTESWYGKGAAKDQAWNAVKGLLMVLVSYIVLKTVNPQLVAIPNSIPAITNAPTVNVMTLFDVLNTQAQQYTLQGQEFLKQAQAAQDKVSQLQQQKSDLQSQLYDQYYDLPDTDPKVQNINAQIASLDSQIKDTQSQELLSQAKSMINNAGIANSLSSMNVMAEQGTLSIDEINHQTATSLAYIRSLKEQTAMKITNANNPNMTNDIVNLNDIANYNNALVELRASDFAVQVAKKSAMLQNNKHEYIIGSQFVDYDTLRSNLTNNIKYATSALNSVNDPLLKADLQKQIKNSQDSLSKIVP